MMLFMSGDVDRYIPHHNMSKISPILGRIQERLRMPLVNEVTQRSTPASFD